MMEYAPAEERTAQLDYLNSLLLGVSAENFNAFDIYNAKYESAGRAIGADILVPKKPASSGPRPVMVRIHGGFLVCVALSCRHRSHIRKFTSHYR